MELEIMQALLIFLAVLAGLMLLATLFLLIAALVFMKKLKKAADRAEYDLGKIALVGSYITRLRGPIMFFNIIRKLKSMRR